jgi:DNA-binding MarR family transcriptional regulator/predicted transcriptional regulator
MPKRSNRKGSTKDPLAAAIRESVAWQVENRIAPLESKVEKIRTSVEELKKLKPQIDALPTQLREIIKEIMFGHASEEGDQQPEPVAEPQGAQEVSPINPAEETHATSVSTTEMPELASMLSGISESYTKMIMSGLSDGRVKTFRQIAHGSNRLKLKGISHASGMLIYTGLVARARSSGRELSKMRCVLTERGRVVAGALSALDLLSDKNKKHGTTAISKDVILRALADRKPLSSDALCRKVGAASARGSVMVATWSLTQSGLARRKKNRLGGIIITEDGIKTLQELDAARKSVAKAMEGFGINEVQAKVLESVRTNGKVNLKSVRYATKLNERTVRESLDVLALIGAVRFRTGPNDSSIYEITDKGIFMLPNAKALGGYDAQATIPGKPASPRTAETGAGEIEISSPQPLGLPSAADVAIPPIRESQTALTRVKHPNHRGQYPREELKRSLAISRLFELTLPEKRILDAMGNKVMTNRQLAEATGLKVTTIPPILTSLRYSGFLITLDKSHISGQTTYQLTQSGAWAKAKLNEIKSNPDLAALQSLKIKGVGERILQELSTTDNMAVMRLSKAINTKNIWGEVNRLAENKLVITAGKKHRNRTLSLSPEGRKVVEMLNTITLQMNGPGIETDFNLKANEKRVLARAIENGRIMVAEASELLGISDSHANKTLKGLVLGGFLDRTSTIKKPHSRVLQFTPTEEGKEVMLSKEASPRLAEQSVPTIEKGTSASADGNSIDGTERELLPADSTVIVPAPPSETQGSHHQTTPGILRTGASEDELMLSAAVTSTAEVAAPAPKEEQDPVLRKLTWANDDERQKVEGEKQVLLALFELQTLSHIEKPNANDVVERVAAVKHQDPEEVSQSVKAAITRLFGKYLIGTEDHIGSPLEAPLVFTAPDGQKALEHVKAEGLRRLESRGRSPVKLAA